MKDNTRVCFLLSKGSDSGAKHCHGDKSILLEWKITNDGAGG